MASELAVVLVELDRSSIERLACCAEEAVC
jgi:hypothetical protein